MSKNERKYQRSASPWVALYLTISALGLPSALLSGQASAVVTDIGCPLSHSSIVSREYGIPAVLAKGVATRRVQDGQIITVNGSAGTVTLS